MEKAELEEYEAKEIEIARKYMDRYWGNESVSVRQFYRDKIPTHERFASPRIGEVPVFMLPAFHEKILLHIQPRFMDETKMWHKFGIDVRDAIELVQEKKIIPILEGMPTEFHWEFGGSVLDPILESQPPSNIRSRAYLDAITEGKYESYLDEASQLGLWEALDYAELCCLGHAKLAKELAEQTMGLFHAACFLCEPLTYHLQGWAQISKDLASEGVSLGLITSEDVKKLIFPIEVGRVLAEAYDLDLPIPTSLEEREIMFNIDSVKKLRELLKELEIATIRKKGEDALSLSEEIKDVLNSAKRDLRECRPKEKEKVWKTITATLVICAIGSISPYLGALSGVIEYLGLGITGELSEGLTKNAILSKVGSLPVSIWKYEKRRERARSV